MVEIAILKLGIQNKLRLNPLQVQVFVDDIILLSYNIEVLHSMLRASEPVMLQVGLDVKLLKRAVFHVRRSGNNRYKGRKNDFPEAIVQSNTLRLCKHDDYHKCLAMSLSLCGEDEKQIEEFLNNYKIFVDQVKSSVLPIALNCSAFNNLALAEILHHFCNTRLSEIRI